MIALQNASLLEVLAGLLKFTYLLNLFGVPTAAVDADLPVKPARMRHASLPEVLETRHLAVDKIAAKVDNDVIAEVHKVKSGKKGKKNKCGNVYYVNGKEEKVVCAE